MLFFPPYVAMYLTDIKIVRYDDVRKKRTCEKTGWIDILLYLRHA